MIAPSARMMSLASLYPAKTQKTTFSDDGQQLVGQKLTGALLGAMQRVFELPMRTSTAKVRLK